MTPFKFSGWGDFTDLCSRVFHGADGEESVILACVAFIGQQCVTDAQSDTFAIAKTGLLHSKLRWRPAKCYAL